jgi:antitoxin component YwqK of YwqJK toxin-antitoxin module
MVDTLEEIQGGGKVVENFRYMNGPWEYFYENGNLKVKGNYNNENKWDGAWDFFNNDGTFDRVEIWKDGNFITSEIIVPD